MDKKAAIINKITAVFLYLCSFLLLSEWIYPLEQLTDTGNIPTFLFFIIMSFAFSLLHVRIIWSTIFKCLFIVYTMNYFYYDASLFGVWNVLLQEVLQNIRFMTDGAWEQLTNPFRSILFYGLLWIMTYLIDYWLFKQRQMFLFVFMTIAYVAVIDTFTEYDASASIIRIVVASFSLLSLLTLSRMDQAAKRLLSRPWYGLLIGMLAISMMSAFAGPKLTPQWPDPVSFLTSVAKIEKDGGVKKAGYSSDDSQLGGPIAGDNETVFIAEVEEPHYWKIETRDYYTGKGWELTAPSEHGVPIAVSDSIPIVGFPHGVTSSERQSTVVMEQLHPLIQYPYGIKYIDPHVMDDEEVLYYSVNELTGKIIPVSEEKPVAISEYTVTYDDPVFDADVLREVVTEPTKYIRRINRYETELVDVTDGTDVELIQSIIDYYTQLPPQLPERTIQLAEEITMGEDNWFDKAVAIETYFGKSGYVYDQKNVALPEEDDDYVDQFLFETKRGYCNNFSTSMVVMLRSLGIPARWAKGYTEGDLIGTTPTGKKQYKITNNDAHSWVEVLFPHVGWVPFEPTKGFVNNVEFASIDGMDEPEDNNEWSEEERQEREEQLERERLALEEERVTTDTLESITFKKVKRTVLQQWKYLLLFVGVLIFVVAVLLKTRGKWLPTYYVWQLRNKQSEATLEKEMDVLLKQLARTGLAKQPSETLRDYAVTVDQSYATNAMTRYVLQYEKYVYKGNLTGEELREMKELWKEIIFQTRT